MGSPTENQPHATPWRDLIKVHEACDLVPPMTDEELQGLAADIQKQGKEGRILAPIAVWRGCENEPWQLLDGRNRLDAAATLPNGETLIRKAIDKPIHKGPETDPYAYVISTNLHRRHLTSEQKREVIGKLLRRDPGRSDRAIAKEVGASPSTVGAERKEQEKTGGVPKLDTRIGQDGIAQPATKPMPTRQPYPGTPREAIRAVPPPHPETKEEALRRMREEQASGASGETPEETFDALASRFLNAVAAHGDIFRGGTLLQRHRLAAKFLDQIDVAAEQLERFLNSPDDGGRS